MINRLAIDEMLILHVPKEGDAELTVRIIKNRSIGNQAITLVNNPGEMRIKDADAPKEQTNG